MRMKCWNEWVSRRRSLAVGILLSGVVPAHYATGQIIEIPSLGLGDCEPRVLNQAGAVAGLSTTVMGDAHAFLYTGTMLDLGTLGGRFSEPWDMNLAGHVVGQSSKVGDLEQRAFLFSNGSMQDLGTLGGSSSLAVGINNQGQVTGSAYVPGDEWHAFVWANGQMVDLGTLGGTYSAAVDINDAGQVVGQSLLTNDFEMRAFLYTGGAMVELGTLGGTESMATAINASGMVIGDSHTADFENHAFLYANGQMVDVGTLGGSYSTANGLNDLGQVIGDSFTTDNEYSRGFLYHNGVLTDLGSLGGGVSAAWGINNHGQVVGYTVDATGAMVAFLWENGVMVDLNSYLPPNSGWQLLAGRFINDAGQIVGFGFLDGRFAQFLLVPQTGNRPPVANAGADATVQCSAMVVLDASGSSDPDGDALSYEWSENGVVLGTSLRLEVPLSLGVHNVRLSVSDSHGASSADDVVITVVDTTVPIVTCPVGMELAADAKCLSAVPDFRSRVLATDNCTAALDLVRAQTPAAGTLVPVGTHPVTVSVTDASGNSSSCVVSLVVVDRTAPEITCPASVRLSPSANCEAVLPDFLLSLMATDNCEGDLVGTQSPPAGTLVSGGTHVVSLVVVDAAGNRTECSVNVTVVDREAPVFTAISATPNVIQSANKHMVPVQVQVQLRDNCDASPAARIVSVTSSDPVTGPGDTTTPDFRITGALTAEVRAERLKSTRVYILTVEGRDAAGNVSLQSVRVSVPKGKEGTAGELKAVSRKAALLEALGFGASAGKKVK